MNQILPTIRVKTQWHKQPLYPTDHDLNETGKLEQRLLQLTKFLTDQIVNICFMYQ